MQTSLNPLQFEAFLQSTVGVMWSFAIVALVTASGWVLKIWLEYWKGRSLHDQQTRYQMGRDLLASRFESFEALWAHMQDLAKYSTRSFAAQDAQQLADRLSGWYFSAKGGMYLTAGTRSCYFALQRLLVVAGQAPDWHTKRRPPEPETLFRERFLTATDAPRFGPDAPIHERPEVWRQFCEAGLSNRLAELARSEDPDRGDAVFAALQQASSVLRSSLAAELQSRLDVERP